MIELKGVSKIYKAKKGVKTVALDNVSFTLPNKGLFFILGKSGSGKSTLLNILGGLDKYDSGDMIVDTKSTKKFGSKDYDYYRNTYIGFIFQEFNLLEEYNVYDNIMLSRKLQKEKVSQTVVDDLLNKVGIDGLGKRRMNELSGGQKQRVAIARALIKNPKIILADEPTGNLDAETGKQIFNLLKSISKEKLVIVVSHDRESALAYADGIIEISNGKIISNSIPVYLETEGSFQAVKSKLPFLSSLKLAFINLKNHKWKLFFTVMLMFMAVLFFGISLVLTKFDIIESHAKTMKNNNNAYLRITKQYQETDDGWSRMLNFIEPDIKMIEQKIEGSPYQFLYRLYENEKRITWDINEEKKEPNEWIPSNSYFMEINPEFLKFDHIIGRMPQDYHEILIHKKTADVILKHGIKLYGEDKYLKLASYEDLFMHEYNLGTEKIKITGIIEDEKKFWDMEETIFGMPSFLEHFSLEPNMIFQPGYYRLYTKYEGREIDLGKNFKMIGDETFVFDGTKMKKIEELKENEIIVPEIYIDKLSNGEYSSLKKAYLEKNPDMEQANIEFLKNYIGENHTLETKISPIYQEERKKWDLKRFDNLKIVGIVLEETTFYLPDTIFHEVMWKNIGIEHIIIKENNETKLRKLLHEFPTTQVEYSGNSIYSVYFGGLTKSLLDSVIRFFRYLSYIFGLFAIILLTNFIATTIYQSKKEIGILRALGARKKDVFRIFLKEGMIIGVIAFALSIIGLYNIVSFINQFISKDWPFKMELVIVRKDNLLFLFLSVVTIIFTSSLLTVEKIAKMKPVDAILNK